MNTTWSWDDHLVSEATPLEPGAGAEPHIRTLCGSSVPAGHRSPGSHPCGTCHERLAELLDGQSAARA